jgi:hypothetical protein
MPSPKGGLKPPAEFRDWYQVEVNQSQTLKEMAKTWGKSTSAVNQWKRWIRENEDDGSYQPLGRDFPTSIYDLSIFHIRALLADFLAFRARHFRTPDGEPFLTEEFHMRWIEAILHAIVTGGRLVILSPPRHGKTELLIHFCTWLIVRFPMIRILWVGGNETIAKRSVGAVQAHLITNQSLVAETLPSGSSYRPDRNSGLAWNKSEFTVSTRPFPIKGTSMTAIGRGGTLLSLDADLIVEDDIEDHKSTIQPGARESTREWQTSQLESRKEEHTALVDIGSRQHPDDLAGHLVENSEYRALVETAHSPTCAIPMDPDHYSEHVQCMLFPAVRSFKWLMEQRQAAETTGGRAHFEMVYLNIAHPKGMTIISPEMVARAIDHSRVIGHIPPYSRLIAGLDPSGTGYQAAFLWALTTDPFKLYMVDLENNEGGGQREARRIISQWKEQYNCTTWAIEQAMWASGLDHDHELKDWASQQGITLRGHLTFTNKWDDYLGVSGFVNYFLAEPCEISLPYGDGPSAEKTDLYRRQLVYFSSSKNTNSRKGYQSDIVMASWFPMDEVRRAVSDEIAEMGVDYAPSYASYTGSVWDSVPWTTTSPWERRGLSDIIGGNG